MAVMKEFKPGDRVEVIKDFSPWFQVGMTGTVISARGDSVSIQQDSSCTYGHGKWGILARYIRHAPAAPDVITINRADLPEVERDCGGYRVDGNYYHQVLDAEDRRRVARENLAIAEFLDAQAAAKETAEKEAADKLRERRDSLAREIDKSAHITFPESADYWSSNPRVRTAIDMIIRLQDEAAS